MPFSARYWARKHTEPFVFIDALFSRHEYQSGQECGRKIDQSRDCQASSYLLAWDDNLVSRRPLVVVVGQDLHSNHLHPIRFARLRARVAEYLVAPPDRVLSGLLKRLAFACYFVRDTLHVSLLVASRNRQYS
jgi:hypothetical protein